MPRQLAQLLQESLGTRAIPVINRLVTQVGVTAVRVFPNDPNRYAWVFVNLSPNTLYLHLDATVTSSKGVQVGPSGGYLSLVWQEDFELTAWEWYAISTAAASNVLTYEVVSEGA